jgi:hypothetical protein
MTTFFRIREEFGNLSQIILTESSRGIKIYDMKRMEKHAKVCSAYLLPLERHPCENSLIFPCLEKMNVFAALIFREEK